MIGLELEIIDENLFILSKDKSVESLGYSVTVKKGFEFEYDWKLISDT